MKALIGKSNKKQNLRIQKGDWLRTCNLTFWDL